MTGSQPPRDNENRASLVELAELLEGSSPDVMNALTIPMLGNSSETQPRGAGPGVLDAPIEAFLGTVPVESLQPKLMQRDLRSEALPTPRRRARVRAFPLAVSVALGIVGAVAVSTGMAIGLMSHDTRPATVRPAATTPTQAPESKLSLEELASAGDPKAVESLAAIDEQRRTPEHVIAVHRGREALRRRQLKELEDSLVRVSDQQRRELLLRIHAFVGTGDISIEALRILAMSDDSYAADLLYETWVGTSAVTSEAELAKQLVRTHAVRSRATPALQVALDLRDAKTCEQVAAILPRAAERGDKRSLVPLTRIAKRYPCPNGRPAACYPCLDASVSIQDAILALTRR